MNYPAPTDEHIVAILAKHGFPAAPVELSPYEGSVNYVRMAGDLCVRVLKEEDFASDIYTEAVSVPTLVQAGLLVPQLLAFDEDRDIVPGLVSIYRRIPGIPLGEVKSNMHIASIYRSLGDQIALWTKAVIDLPDPQEWLDKPKLDHLEHSYERNADRLTTDERVWVEQMIDRLRVAEPGSSTFVHWDLHAHNILVDHGQLSGVIDWGDAGSGETAINYHCLPAANLPILLERFGNVSVDLVGRCLAGSLGYALNDVHRPSPESQPYRNSGHRRWLSFMDLYEQNLDESWQHWLGDAPKNAR